MKNNYQVSLTELRHERFGPVFEAVEQACTEVGISFYLVGAVARDIWLTGIHKIPSGRITRDLDLALLIPHENDYWKLREILLRTGQFNEVRNAPVTLLYQGAITLDLIPFGDLEVADGLVVLHRGEGVTNIQVNGFTEVFDEATEWVDIDKHYHFRVCTLPGMVVLKLIAFSDRPEHRLKDLEDVAFIMVNYVDIVGEELYEEQYDLLEANMTLQLISARILGRHLRPLLAKSKLLHRRIIEILNEQILIGEDSPLARSFRLQSGSIATTEGALQQLNELRHGIIDETPPFDSIT
jgi:predicted nucleotidyltransferase